MVSYCIVCDSLPGNCEHDGVRYLDAPGYERVPGVGWRVPDHERERFDNPPRRIKHAKVQAAPIQALIVQLENWVFLDTSLEQRVRSSYDHNPARTSRAVEHVVSAAQNGKAHNAGGLLLSLLKKITTPEATA